ncbi:MAG: hypothetical protein M3498_18105 [Deinococcota bacterium]|jgi:hypothetical protein|nr:hypothetical protein [Deinococcota bacterium]
MPRTQISVDEALHKRTEEVREKIRELVDEVLEGQGPTRLAEPQVEGEGER